MYQAVDAALIRVASYPRDLMLPAWPDLTLGQPDEWLGWLRQVWRFAEFAAAVEQAAPHLATQIERALADEPMDRRRLCRLVEATVRYLLRWTTRATPFGRFAGVAPVMFGPRAVVRWGEQHHEVVRPDERQVAEQVSAAEQNLAMLRTVQVVTNSLGYARGGIWVVPCAHIDGDRVWDAEIDLTDPVRVAIETARTPIAFSQLAATMWGAPANVAAAESLLAALVRAGVLVSAIRPPMTVTNRAEHLADSFALPEPNGQIAVDLRIDCSVTLPPAVVREAADAASALVAVAPRLVGWAAYHRAFLERWGPRAAVPLHDVLAVLGFPAGYRGSPRRGPVTFTARDRLLTALAQQSALDGGTEVVLDDELLGSLRGDDDRPPIPHTELRFALAAGTPCDLDRGRFMLTVVSGARHAGVAAARFLHLLTPAELERFRGVYTSLPTATPGAASVQLSAPPLDVRLAAVARAPELLPLLPVGDFHPGPRWTVADLAVAADSDGLWLLSRSTGRPVEPLLVNCVRLPTGQQPLVRFLTEIWTAGTAPCARFDWGHARGLPFLPRVRRGRSILHPARWTISATALGSPAASWPDWKAAWQRHRERHRLPREVLVGDDDVRLRLDLDENAHLAVLRSHFDRHGRAVLTEAGGPADWIDGRPAEFLLTLARIAADPHPADRQARPVSTLTHRPGPARWLDIRLHGQSDQILARLGDFPNLPGGWWFLRHPHPEPHLRLRIPLAHTARFADVAHDLAGWAQRLHDDGLLADYMLATYRPETRYGTGQALTAAEAVFAADSHAALGRLSGDRQAATAAGMIAIADGFTGAGARWLVEHAPYQGGPRLSPAQLAAVRVPYGDAGLASALATYRTLATRDGLNTDQLLAELLHLHHARMIGPDTACERYCLRLARAVSHTDLARRAS
ncbi:lantibiotic dehydratase [Frankia sp. B2]|uniref:lantibiotic dehydratase n=1 Tax=unclassified Frankia TaxID=2632575 RepID=UPI0006CA5285|nr:MULTISPECIES: lantibiotic dehydratase [unclassified Frankia]KPM56936.1 lantibiotic dehydratase [Frankia sp. R43]TFE26202.1 lantibiotic dehydratase [Frankia sp. B2]